MRILFVHQSADLYGSDKVLLDLVTRLADHGIEPVVLIPCEGPLLAALRDARIEAHVCPVLKLSRASLRPLGFLKFLSEIPGVIGAIDRIVAGRKIDIVHSNTLAVLGGALWALRRRIQHVWHLHETIHSPAAAARLFPWLVRLFADRVACNSHSTREWLLQHQPCLASRSCVIWNGVAAPSPQMDAASHVPGGAVTTIGLVGRINRMKGQTVLIEAAERLAAQGVDGFRVVFVGSPPPGQEHFLDALRARIDQSPISDRLTLQGFSSDIWRIWKTIDIACVPSIEPESFGLVAVEAMATGLPVVASAHGGILEIVRDGETGWLCEPGSVPELSARLNDLLASPARRAEFGAAGERVYRDCFSVPAMMQGFVKLYRDMV
ncbi:glycosyltransferase family 4 protein [Paludibacterium paludis]|uniref:Glycosyl transferase n=1 Tax=Paludibacterium paludis TaxID=1225769 RepID=A0A918UA93_9NEIS|nr:glycosyltransferase family 4 protein [Paludibacterium paludis]GGY15627.1 glycosyl transferase [Paludibacterium paludis]